MPLTRKVDYGNLRNKSYSATPNSVNLDTITYDDRYPGLDEYNYKKLENKIDNLGLTGYDKEKAMDEGYLQVLPIVQTQIKNSDRRKYINQAEYEVSQIPDSASKKTSNMKLEAVKLAQDIKEHYNIDPTMDDEYVLKTWTDRIPDGRQLLADYLNNGDKEILYKGGLYERPVQEGDIPDTIQGGIKGKIATAGSNTESGDWLPNAWEFLNPIGYLTEVLDTGTQKFADIITLGKAERKNLIKEINNLSQEDLQQYKKWYDESGYDGSFEDYIIDMNKTWWQDLVGADEELKGIAEPNVFKFFGNMPASTLRLVSASLKNASNPIDSLKGLGKLIGTKEGWNALRDRYLTAEGWANALNYDSVGAADEVLSITNALGGLAGGVGKLTGSSGLQNFGNTLSKVGSPFDVAVDRALYGGDITYGTNVDNMKTTNVKGLYGTMDDIAKDNKVLQGINRYAQDTSSKTKLLENAKSDLQSIRGVANTWADRIVQNNNRMTKKQQETFKKMSGNDEGKWMNDRGIKTESDLADYFLESKSKVDDAMAKIDGEFTSKQLTAVLDDSVDFAKKTENKDLRRLQQLQTKNANGGLTMSEINEVKRFYEKNNKFNYLKEGTAEKSALATNRDTALREWQQKVAEDAGLDNLKELNKETQAAKYLANNVTSWQSGIKGNNPISLTDWIVFAGDGVTKGSLRDLVGKKVFQAPRFQEKLVDVLNYIGGREKIEIPEPNMKEIQRRNESRADAQRIEERKNEMRQAGEAAQKAILAEKLAKIKSEQDFNAWLEEAEYMAGPALPYNPRYDNQAPIDYTNPIVVTPGGQSVRQGQIADIGITNKDLGDSGNLN